MSVSSLTAVFYHSQSTNSERMVMIALANFDNGDGAWPSLATLERVTGGLNRRTIQRAIDKLILLGEIEEVRREGSTNLYRITLGCPEICDKTTKHNLKGGGVETTPAESIQKSVEIIPGGRSGDHGGGGVQTTLTKENLTNERERKQPKLIPSDFKPKTLDADRVTYKDTDIDLALSDFISYWTEQRKKKADWDATWRNNIGKVADWDRYQKKQLSFWDALGETK